MKLLCLGVIALLLRNLILPIVVPLSMKTARRIAAYRIDRDPALAEPLGA